MSEKKHQNDIGKSVKNLFKFLDTDDEWINRCEQVFNEMLSPVSEQLDRDSDDIIEQIEIMGLWPQAYNYIFERFISDNRNDDGSFIDEFLKRRGWREAPYAQRYLRALNESNVQLWQVIDVVADRYVDVRKLDSQDAPIRVHDNLASQSLSVDDCIIARVVNVDEQSLFTGAILSLPLVAAEQVNGIIEEAQKVVIEDTRKLIKSGEVVDLDPAKLALYADEDTQAQLPEILFAVWAATIVQSQAPDLPSLANTDGEAFELINVRFPVNITAKKLTATLDAVAELDRHEDDKAWAWFPKPVAEIADNETGTVLGFIILEKKSLELAVNSKQRADKGTQWLQALLGDAIGTPLTSYSNLQDALQNQTASPIENAIPAEEEQALLQAFYQQHYRNVIEEPVPALNNKTPRECAADPAMQAKVIVWLKGIERGARQQNQDVSWLWQALNLSQE